MAKTKSQRRSIRRQEERDRKRCVMCSMRYCVPSSVRAADWLVAFGVEIKHAMQRYKICCRCFGRREDQQLYGLWKYWYTEL